MLPRMSTAAAVLDAQAAIGTAATTAATTLHSSQLATRPVESTTGARQSVPMVCVHRRTERARTPLMDRYAAHGLSATMWIWLRGAVGMQILLQSMNY